MDPRNVHRWGCTDLSRRQFMQIGSLGALGLSLSQLMQQNAGAAPGKPAGQPPTQPLRHSHGQSATRKPAKSCILFFLEGGPSHIDLWDMKPQAPPEVRGDFSPISTSTPGLVVCEHLPRLAQQMHHVALIRSVHHKVVDHNAGAYYALTGQSPVRGNRLIIKDEPENFPPFGSVLSELRPVPKTLPPFVHLPDIMSNNGHDLPGQRAGFASPRLDPLVAGDPSEPGYRVPGLLLPSDVSLHRVDERRTLLGQINQFADERGESRMSLFQQQAYELISSNDARNAFDLSQEPAAVRERYGLPDRTDRSVEARKFGGLPHLGQCLLTARRLIEAGVRLVTVCSGRRIDQAWDTHRDHFPLLKQSLLPYTDLAFSALLEDLHQRGLLEETLVVAMGEFGRTPRLGQITSGAGADKAGRDHWPHCYTVLLAGGGVQGGAIYGESDRFAAYPAKNPVTPEDVAATIYAALGVDPETRIKDRLNRPHTVSSGQPIREIF